MKENEGIVFLGPSLSRGKIEIYLGIPTHSHTETGEAFGTPA